jgi:hypothetical protein
MSAPKTPSARSRQHAVPWIARVSSWLVAIAVAMGTNLVSNDVGYRGVAVLAAIGGMGLAAVWLRGFKPDSVLAVWTVRGLLLIALVAIIAATILSTKLSGLAVLVAALATFGATLIRSEPAGRLALLTAVVLVGMGGGMIADSISPSAPRVTSNGRLMSAVLGGLFVIVGMLVMWAGRSFVPFIKDLFGDLFRDAQPQLWTVGVFGVAFGVLVATSGEVEFGIAGMLFGVGIFGVLGGYGRRRAELIGLGSIVIGLAAAPFGVAGIADGSVLLGSAVIGISIVFVTAGSAYLAQTGVLSRLRRWFDAARLYSDEQESSDGTSRGRSTVE